jgi:hypothetical protein
MSLGVGVSGAVMVVGRKIAAAAGFGDRSGYLGVLAPRALPRAFTLSS